MEYIGVGVLIVLGMYIAPVLIQLLLITIVLIIKSITDLFDS